jgi:cytochrome b pre-mRNA-processing protein 3
MKLVMKLAGWLSPDTAGKDRARQQYITLVRQSRNPFFYRDCAVPDTLDGRFEILVLHLSRTLRKEQDAKAKQWLLETFFADMDGSLREMGVGDMSVGKKMRVMAEAAFGRLKAYEEAWSSREALMNALRKNVYAGQAAQPALEALTDYCLREAAEPASL